MKKKGLPLLAWRTVAELLYNVYEGNRLVCQCPSVSDAARIVHAMNAVVDTIPAVDPVPNWDAGPKSKPSSRAPRKDHR